MEERNSESGQKVTIEIRDQRNSGQRGVSVIRSADAPRTPSMAASVLASSRESKKSAR